ncbi:MAG: DEAD/DEAH box helicase family protein [Candidatus Gracilibacteria bacterium]|nr:DEAD/DEAH box helicase family protein [Candidatus Gracilibacteria bacterium]
MFTYIIPFGKTFDDVGFTYKIPDFLKSGIKLGQIVEFELKNEITYGVIYEFVDLNIENTFVIKEILSIKNDFVFISNYRLELLKFISKNYFTPIHNSLSLFIPKNLIDKVKKEKIDLYKQNLYKYNYDFPLELTSKQQDIYENILKSENNKILLFGVTGSGKTEIYIKLIKKYLDEGKQTLFLIPEIILGNQIYTKIKKVFGDDVIILNSTITETQKTKYFLDIYHNNAKIILGTRSSLFYPYNNLGLIIIDEEHDNSYISDQSPRYNAVEIANKISELNNSKLLLASGTPSVNSMYKGIKKEYNLLNLLDKYKKN